MRKCLTSMRCNEVYNLKAVFLTVAASLLLYLSHVANAQDFFEIVDIQDTQAEESSSKPWQFRGHIQQELKYGLQAPDSSYAFERNTSGLSQFRTETFLEFKYRFSNDLSAQISAKNEIDYLRWEAGEKNWQIKNYDTLLKDAYVDYTFSNDLWLRVGNQVIAWGESEGLSITDVLSTQDFREPGQAALEDIRESLPAILLSKPFTVGDSNSNLNLALTYKAGTDRYAQTQEDFYPLVTFKTANTATNYSDLHPGKDWELAFQYIVHANGGDYAFVLAETNKNTPELFNLQLDTQTDQISNVEFFQRRQLFYGISANKVINSFLLRSEFGVITDSELPSGSNVELVRNKEKRLMFGTEYSGWTDWLFSLEYDYLDRSPRSYSLIDERSSGFVLRTQYTAFNEKLITQLWYLKLADQGGEISRLTFTYKPIDNWEINAAYVIYENDKPNSTLYPFRNNDTINLALKYGF